MKIVLKLVSALLLAIFSQVLSAQEICIGSDSEQISGKKDGFRYELWNQYSQGNACMTISEGALFSGEWSGIENYLARRGLEYNQKREHQEIGTFFAQYKCNYNPLDSVGNSYLSIYGWTVEPLAEFYIIENWCRWIPSMDKNAVFKGTVEINGSVYDIYENTRVNQPSIQGNTTFKQYFSIRKDKRNRGTVNISEHFNKWESLGMEMGKMHEVSFVVEGYHSSGSFEFKELNLFYK